MTINALRINKIIESNLFKKESTRNQFKEIFYLINNNSISEEEFVYLMEHPEEWRIDLNN